MSWSDEQLADEACDKLRAVLAHVPASERGEMLRAVLTLDDTGSVRVVVRTPEGAWFPEPHGVARFRRLRGSNLGEIQHYRHGQPVGAAIVGPTDYRDDA